MTTYNRRTTPTPTGAGARLFRALSACASTGSRRRTSVSKLPPAVTLCAALALLGGCGAQFAAPGRGDLGFTASKVKDGDIELTATGLPTGTWQGDLRVGLSDNQAVEVSVLGHDWPGERYGFALGGVGYRHWLLRGDSPVHLSVGGGLAAGVGGWNNHMDDTVAHYTPAGALWLDVGVSAPLTPWLTAFVGARAQGSAAFTDDEATEPPSTLWLQAGGGLRADVGPAFMNLAYQVVRYDNALDADGFHSFEVGVGWRF